MSKVSKFLHAALADKDADGLPDIIAKLIPAAQLLMYLYALLEKGHNVSEHIAVVSDAVGMSLDKNRHEQMVADAKAFTDTHHETVNNPDAETTDISGL